MTQSPPLLTLSPQGLFCPAGDFHIDPWQPVPRAVITHAHADHARPGSRSYLAAAPGEALLRLRLGEDIELQSQAYGEAVRLGDVQVSFHPAGHVLGSAQIRIEHKGRVWVVSGDYKTDPDPTCAPFEPIPCEVFVTESTFALPVFRWPSAEAVRGQILRWWQENADARRPSLLLAYSLGKAQRLLAGLEGGPGPIYTHGAVERLTEAYRSCGIALPRTRYVGEAPDDTDWRGALILAPPGAFSSPWSRRFRNASAALASGWMRVRGMRRRWGVDRGFVVSDHADWQGLLSAIEATGAGEVWVTHGYRRVLARWLEEKGLKSLELETEFEGERSEQEASTS